MVWLPEKKNKNNTAEILPFCSIWSGLAGSFITNPQILAAASTKGGEGDETSSANPTWCIP